MLEICFDPDFAEEPVVAKARGQFGMQNLERDRPMVLDVLRKVHRRHAAPPQSPFDGVAVGEGQPDLSGCVRHGDGTAGGSSRSGGQPRSGDSQTFSWRERMAAITASVSGAGVAPYSAARRRRNSS